MVYAGPSAPPHLQSTAAYPEAMLALKTGIGEEPNWADVMCPFEFAYNSRCIERVSALPLLANGR